MNLSFVITIIAAVRVVVVYIPCPRNKGPAVFRE